jgi:hypothetical protein
MEIAEKHYDLGTVNKLKKLVQDTKFLAPFGTALNKVNIIFKSVY